MKACSGCAAGFTLPFSGPRNDWVDASRREPSPPAAEAWLAPFISLRGVECFLEIRDHDLLHLEHGIGGGHGLVPVRAAEELTHLPGNDLPGEAEPVLEPAALLGLGAGREPAPEVVDLVLVGALHIE